MTQQTKNQQKKPAQTHPFPLAGQNQPSTLAELNKQKLKAEEHEIAGRHKNDGQKAHKGAR
jgi:hypothetical protein